MKASLERISGWGRYPRGETLWLPYKEGRLRGMGIARGLGRSYGDASFCSEGHTWDMQAWRQVLSWDSESGLLVAEAGLSLYEVIRRFLPAGWFPAVVPGTQFVTLGGAFASNIHGKNHHVDGSFADYVAWIDLRLPDGTLRRVEPKEPLFWVTAGGMGLTGVIERLALCLQRIPTSFIQNQVHKVPDWEKALALMESQDKDFPFAVAWLDHFHPRNRAILHLGRWADAPPPKKSAYAFRTAGRLSVPFPVPFPVFRYAGGIISEWYWHKHKEGVSVISYAPYFFPLDGVRQWNYLWGLAGFIQFQFVVPRAEGFIRLWKRLREAPARSFLTVLKRLGPQKGPLAFSGPGWTLAIDLPNTLEVQRFLRGLTEEVLSEDGKIYLTKDSLLWPEAFRAAYPAWKDFLAIKAQVDPQQVLCSDLSRRVGLTA
ncbi:MAG: FAD-binding oxidoreductase [Bacteroidia bacterium]|nr:FAD-binding oxidoreductase [Bacteroidia bacterium]GIV22515.1 MAG: oxidoreductase [Bacteroidia bacterium]